MSKFICATSTTRNTNSSSNHQNQQKYISSLEKLDERTKNWQPKRVQEETRLEQLYEQGKCDLFRALSPYRYYHIHKNTRMDVLDDLIDYAKMVKNYTIDTEDQLQPKRPSIPALIQIEDVYEDDPSIILLIECMHLPEQHEPTFIKIKQLFKIIFSTKHTIYAVTQLHTLHIDLIKIYVPEIEIENQAKIPNLKCFFLSCAWKTSYYNELILPLLHRMLNLEKLGLDLTVYMNERFIDGNDLKENILNRLLQLNQFTFDIHSFMSMNNQMDFPSQEDIQQTFRDFPCTKIISRVDYFFEEKEGQCHVYSYPFLMEYYEEISNNFPGGSYPYVRVVSLHDEHPFEHEFFIRISQSFPLMERLTLINRYAQNYKQSYKSMNNNQNLSIVKYCYLTELDIERVHDDYIEEFLCNTKTCLQSEIFLDVDFKSLERVTHSFTRDDTRINCAKINKMLLRRKVEYDYKILQDYFPFTKIY